MKNIYKPILFSTEMVQAILGGRKTQTRRVLKIQKPSDGEPNQEFYLRFLPNDQLGPLVFYSKKPKGHIWINCDGEISKYDVGNILWVREKVIEWPKGQFQYEPLPFGEELGNWIAPIKMPKEAARIFLKVTNVRCERLQDVSEDDAIAEGIELYGPFGEYKGDPHPSGGMMRFRAYSKAARAFQDLWDSINAKKHPWSSNPWVWVYEFERIEKPENFIP